MKLIYIAAPWVDKDKMPAIAEKFEREGFVITHKWWYTNEDDKTNMSSHALEDYEGVMAADFLVLFNTSKSEGKAVEQGIALAHDKTIIAIGDRSKRSNIFQHLSNYTWFEHEDYYLYGKKR